MLTKFENGRSAPVVGGIFFSFYALFGSMTDTGLVGRSNKCTSSTSRTLSNLHPQFWAVQWYRVFDVRNDDELIRPS